MLQLWYLAHPDEIRELESNFPHVRGKLTLWLVPLSLNLMNYWQQRLDSMTLLFFLTCSELMHCGNPSHCSAPACGAGGENVGALEQSLSGFWFQGTGLQGVFDLSSPPVQRWAARSRGWGWQGEAEGDHTPKSKGFGEKRILACKLVNITWPLPVWAGLIFGLQRHFFGENTGDTREGICEQKRVEGRQEEWESPAPTTHQDGLLEMRVGNLWGKYICV